MQKTINGIGNLSLGDFSSELVNMVELVAYWSNMGQVFHITKQEHTKRTMPRIAHTVNLLSKSIAMTGRLTNGLMV